MWQFTFLFRISACQYLGRAFCMEMNFNLHYNIQETSFEYKRRDQELAIQIEEKYKKILDPNTLHPKVIPIYPPRCSYKQQLFL
jgi:hypothetical protein